MPRLLFEKTGSAVYMSHLDLMRLFQRAFKRADLPLWHTQGFNQRPAVSIALPLSLGTASVCELLDFDLVGENLPSNDEVRSRLNTALVRGITVRSVYDDGRKLKELTHLECRITMHYDKALPADAQDQIAALFASQSLVVQKKGKNGIVDQDILPMIRRISARQTGERTMELQALVCAQNPTLNPMQIVVAIEKYLPDLKPDFAQCIRLEIFDTNEEIFR